MFDFIELFFYCIFFWDIGDPGSPIFEWFEDRWQQVGIASYGIDCVQFRNLGIYTRIIEYKNWIQSITNTYPTPLLPTTTTNRIITAVITPDTTTISEKDPIVYQCNQTSTCGCGLVPVVLTPSRIVGGEKAVDYSWPMMVALRWPYENNQWCGGTILSNSYILTAAHCIQGYISDPPVDLTISAGMTDLSDTKQIRRTVDRIYMHPNYIGISDDYRHDIALLHMNQPLPIGSNLFLTKTCIHPVIPPVLNDQYIKNGTRLTTIGWGVERFGSLDQPTLLRQVEVYAIDNEDPSCVAAMNDTQTQFCAGLIEGGKG
jgi:secreted trypsin-like serine protease